MVVRVSERHVIIHRMAILAWRGDDCYGSPFRGTEEGGGELWIGLVYLTIKMTKESEERWK